jgi:hypothetical protein
MSTTEIKPVRFAWKDKPFNALVQKDEQRLSTTIEKRSYESKVVNKESLIE